MSYQPEPLDTSRAELPATLDSLVERLARQIHDLWAQRRIDEGWRHGPTRDDAARTHPGLVPYDQLPESEKEYDRQTALEALRTVVLLGYRIVPPDEGRWGGSTGTGGPVPPGEADPPKGCVTG